MDDPISTQIASAEAVKRSHVRSRKLVVAGAFAAEYAIVFGTLAILMALPDAWKSNQHAVAFGVASLFLLAFSLMSALWSVIDEKHADGAIDVAAGEFVASFGAFLVMLAVVYLPQFFIFMYEKLATGPIPDRLAWAAGISFLAAVILAWLGLSTDREVEKTEPECPL